MKVQLESNQQLLIWNQIRKFTRLDLNLEGKIQHNVFHLDLTISKPNDLIYKAHVHV